MSGDACPRPLYPILSNKALLVFIQKNWENAASSCLRAENLMLDIFSARAAVDAATHLSKKYNQLKPEAAAELVKFVRKRVVGLYLQHDDDFKYPDLKLNRAFYLGNPVLQLDPVPFTPEETQSKSQSGNKRATTRDLENCWFAVHHRPEEWWEDARTTLLAVQPDAEIPAYGDVLTEQAHSQTSEPQYQHSDEKSTQLNPGEVNEHEFVTAMICGKCSSEIEYEKHVVHPVLGVGWALMLSRHSGLGIVLVPKKRDKLKACVMITSDPPMFVAGEVTVSEPEADVRVVEVGVSQALGKVRAVGEVKVAGKGVSLSKPTSRSRTTTETAHGEGLPSEVTDTPRALHADACSAGVQQTVAVEGSTNETDVPFTLNISHCSAKEVATNETWGLKNFNLNRKKYETFRQALTQMAAASSPYGLVVWGTHIVIMLMTRVKPCEETDQQHKIGPSVNLRSKATQLHPQQVKVIALVMRCHAFEPTVFQMLDMAARLYKPLMDQKLRFCVRRNLIRLCEPSTGSTSQHTTDETKSHSGGGDQDASNIDSTGGGPATRSKKGSKDKQSGGQTSRETGEPGAGKSSNLHFMAAPFLKEPSPESCHKPPRRPKPCGEWQQCAHAVPLQSMLDLHPRPCAHVRVIGPVPGQPELLLCQAQPRNAVTVKLATSFIGARPSTEYEFQVLEDLRHIQGTWVPYAVCTTYVSLLYFRAAALLLEYVGPWSAEHLRRSYVRSIRDRIAAAFKALHEHGVCHGDVALRNVVVSYDHWPVIIDFERSIRRCTYDQAPGAWQKLVADEWQEVLDMLEYSSGEKPLLVTEGSEGTSGQI